MQGVLAREDIIWYIKSSVCVSGGVTKPLFIQRMCPPWAFGMSQLEYISYLKKQESKRLLTLTNNNAYEVILLFLDIDWWQQMVKMLWKCLNAGWIQKYTIVVPYTMPHILTYYLGCQAYKGRDFAVNLHGSKDKQGKISLAIIHYNNGEEKSLFWKVLSCSISINISTKNR